MESAKCRVLLLKSQSEDDNDDPYLTVLNEWKIPAVLLPTLEFQFVNLDLLHACLNTPEKYSGFIFVSPRCVQSVIECFDRGMQCDTKREWTLLQCYVIGEATARLVRENLQLTCSGSSSGNMKALLRTIDPCSLKKPLLMPCGNLNSDIPEEKDYNIEKVCVYKTQPHPQLTNRLRESLEDVLDLLLIVFFSPSGVEYAWPHIQNVSNRKIQFIALGPTTCKAMEERDIKVSAVCEKPNPQSLINEIAKIIR